MNQGKVTLREVGSKSKEMTFSQEDSWVVEALKLAAPHEDICGKSPEEWAIGSTLKGELRIERLDPEYSLSGNMECRLPLLCPRCGVDGTVSRSADFRIFLKPLGPHETFEEGDDPDYMFLETPYIDLVKVLSEQIVASEPVVERPDLELSGQPHTCAEIQNLLQESDVANEFHLSSGQNDGKAGNSPFAILGKLNDLSKETSTAPKSSKKNKE